MWAEAVCDGVDCVTSFVDADDSVVASDDYFDVITAVGVIDAGSRAIKVSCLTVFVAPTGYSDGSKWTEAGVDYTCTGVGAIHIEVVFSTDVEPFEASDHRYCTGGR